MAYATQHRRAILVLAAIALLLASPTAITTRAVAAAAAAAGCEGDKLPAGRSYAHCAALPSLGARLHWTYDANKTGSLSVAFVAKPAGAGGAGWVSWAINPTGEGMKGAQALLAFKSPAAPSSYVVNTYNVTGYTALGAASTPIAYRAAELAADESGGEVRVYGRLQLGPGLEKVSHIWQVGSAVAANGAPVKHAFDTANLEAKGTLVLSGAAMPVEAAPAPAPAPAGSGGASPAKGGGGGAAPSGGSSNSAAAAAATYVSSVSVLTLLAALADFLAM